MYSLIYVTINPYLNSDPELVLLIQSQNQLLLPDRAHSLRGQI